jgi:uncharacterized protein YcgI (DUF1989 family)
MFEIQCGGTAPHPNCYQNLTRALSSFGAPAATVTVAFNVFMCTSVAADGRLSVSPPRSRPGGSIIFRAERGVIVAVSACRHLVPTVAWAPDHSRLRSPT